MSLNKVLVSLGLILALFAAFIGTPKRGDRNLDNIASLIETEQDHITPLELAEQIYSGKKLRLIDLRDSISHFQLDIIHSELMSVHQLLMNGIQRNELTVLYSDGGIHASQAWILLKLKQYDSVYTLLGGFEGWKEEVLYPTLHAGATEVEKQEVARRKMLSQFFGGEPKVDSLESSRKKSVRQDHPPKKQDPTVKAKKEEEKLRYHC